MDGVRVREDVQDAELAAEGIHVVSFDPGDMDTPLHALAVPDADRSELKQPEAAASELLSAIAPILSRRHVRDGSLAREMGMLR